MRLALILIVATSCRAGFEVPTDADPSSSDAGTDALVPGCGNGVVESGERCDDGNESDSDGCLSDCTMARCGDGIVRTTVEGCDDGNDELGDGCTASCLTAPDATTVVCTANDRCFGLYSSPISWASLETVCNERGGRRAVVNSIAENDLIADRLALTAPAWIGLEWDDNWSWGPPEGDSGFLRFAPGFPTVEATGQSVLLRTDGQWQNANQTETHPYVCLFEDRWVIDPNSTSAYRSLLGVDTFAGSRLRCQLLGFDLASVTSAEEQLLVTSAGRGVRNWLGLMFDSEAAEQTWVDGEPLGYTNWTAGSPRTGTNCVELERNGQWETETCSGFRLALCEAK